MSPAQRAAASLRQHPWRWATAAVLALATVLLLVWAARTIGLPELVIRFIAELRSLGAPVFFSAMALLPAVGFPLSPFALAAGPAFAPTLGTGGVILCAILAVSVNVSLSYALASSVFRPPVERLMLRLGYALPDPSRHRAWLVTLLARIAPGLPFWAQSYLLGLVRVKFAPYLLVSTLVPAGYVTAAILFGDALRLGRPGPALVALALVVVVGLTFYFLRKKFSPPRASPPPAS